MSFYTHTPGCILITDLEVDVAELLDSTPSESAQGWDTLRETYLLRTSVASPLALLLDESYQATFARGATLYDTTAQILFITSTSPRQRAPGLFQIEVNSSGILSPRGFKISYDGLTQNQSLENALFPDEFDVPTVFPRVSVKERNVTAVIELPLIGIAPSAATFPTADIGDPVGAVFPSDTLYPADLEPVVPASVWAFLLDPTYHYPNGWILDSVNLENLAGLPDVYWAKYKFIHQHPYSP